MSFDAQTDVFEYTDALAVSGSSFVDTIAYDADSKQLVTVLESGDYLYEGVPADVFNDFKSAHSKGQFYNNWIKRGSYAPGTSIYVDDFSEKRKTVPAPDMSAVTTNASTLHVNSMAGNASYSLPNGTFSLFTLPSQPVPEKATLLHTVSFTVEGGNNVKTYDVEAESVADAVESLGESLDALGLDYNVKGVYVSFE